MSKHHNIKSARSRERGVRSHLKRIRDRVDPCVARRMEGEIRRLQFVQRAIQKEYRV